MANEIYKKLLNVQQALRVPKDRKNDFGGYVFRNAADILEKAKPHLADNGCVIILSDSVINLGSESRFTCTDIKSPLHAKEVSTTPRYYITATATIVDVDSGTSVSVSAHAREEEDKKGMDAAQLTGACSSYARKYALCGLLAIDDSSLDPDETNDHGKGGKDAPRSAPTTDATKNTPTPSARAQASSSASSAKHQASPKYKEAWKLFLGLESVKALEDTKRANYFKQMLKAKTGKIDPYAVTDAEWDGMVSYIASLGAL